VNRLKAYQLVLGNIRRLFRGGVLATALLSITTVLTLSAAAEEIDIEVVGLFANAVMLKVDGEQKLLKKGETSAEGIYLEQADSRGATIEYQGRRQILGLSERISSSFEEAALRTVSVQMNNRGQYLTAGSINGRPVRFLVDTGANMIALNSVMARGLGLDVASGKKMRANTAGGTIDSTEVLLATVIVGGIKVTNVQAAVLEGEFPTEILLGMSFLRNVKIEKNAGLMTLTSQF